MSLHVFRFLFISFIRVLQFSAYNLCVCPIIFTPMFWVCLFLVFVRWYCDFHFSVHMATLLIYVNTIILYIYLVSCDLAGLIFQFQERFCKCLGIFCVDSHGISKLSFISSFLICFPFLALLHRLGLLAQCFVRTVRADISALSLVKQERFSLSPSCRSLVDVLCPLEEVLLYSCFSERL